MKIFTRTITGSLHAENRDAIDWGWQGLVAYGCHNVVVIVDPVSMQVVQTLEKHKGYVQRVRWRSENFYHSPARPYRPCLASADHNGHVIVWEVTNGSVLTDFRDGTRPVSDMHWICRSDVSDSLLAVLHQPCSLALYNADSGAKVWKKTYTDVLLTFSIDPFDSSRIGFMGKDFILFVDDFSPTRVPPSSGKRYYMFGAAASGKSNRSENLPTRMSRALLPRRMTAMLVGGDTSKKVGGEENESSGDLIQLIFHPARRHHLVLLYPQEILILDLDIQQTVAAVTLEKSAALFAQVFPLRQKDGLLCLHENGAVSVRCRSGFQVDMASSTDGAAQQSAEVVYETRCMSESLRQTKYSKISGFSVCPVSESRFTIVTTDGRTMVWQLFGTEIKRPLATVKDLVPTSPKHQIPPGDAAVGVGVGAAGAGVGAAVGVGSSHLKFTMCGLLSGTPATPYSIRMCPPLTTKNWNQYKPLLAVGSSSGSVQIYNLSTFSQVKEIMVHTYGIRGVAWASLQSVLTFASSQPGTVSGLVKNEVMLTDLLTGRVTVVRPSKDEESPIDALKVSYYRQYFVVVMKDKPLELWDAVTCQLLKQLPAQFSAFSQVEWSPLNSNKSAANKKPGSGDGATAQTPTEGGTNMASLLDTGDTLSNDTNMKTPESPDVAGPSGLATVAMPTREWLVCTAASGAVSFVAIEGSHVSETSRFMMDTSLGSVVAVAMKAELITLADNEGNIFIFNIKTRKSRMLATQRSGILKMRFAPGRGYMKLLVVSPDGAEVYDIKDGGLDGSLKLLRDGTKLMDADWAASDRPVLAFRDGIIRVLDMTLAIGTSNSFEDSVTQEPVLCPYLLAPASGLLLKQLLCHQPWSNAYKLHFDDAIIESQADKLAAINAYLGHLDNDVKEHFLHAQHGTITRCLAVAQLFGDECDVIFWTIACHYLLKEKQQLLVDVDANNVNVADQHDINKDVDCLDIGFDIYCENSIFQQYQLYRTHLLDIRRGSYEHTKQCIEKFILLGQPDRAVQLLLETEPSNDAFYCDSLKACLAAGAKSSAASQSAVKLAATNLIANGKLMEGTELLCLIGKVPDACRYLQTYGEWYMAAWLAKASLDVNESNDVIKRWSDSLSPHEHTKAQAVLLLISQRNYMKALELMHAAGYVERAALFARVLGEFNILPTGDNGEDTKKLLSGISLDYARLLARLGFQQGAEHYCRVAGGDEGKELLDKITTAFSAKS